MKLILSIDLIRHADRTSVHHVPGISADSYAQDKMGRLTSQGEQNAIKLGRELKKYYVEEHGLLSHSYQFGDILVKSSDFQRTKKTADCIMKGIYESHSELIKIDTLPKQKDLLFLGFVYEAGQELQNLIRPKHSFSTKLSEDITRQINFLLKKLNVEFDTNFNDVIDILKIADVIKTDEMQREFLSDKIGNKEVERIFYFAELVFIDVFGSPELAHAGAGELIKEALKIIVNKIQDKISFRYVLFSGHDTNVLAAMKLLDLQLNGIPPYLANLRFELFQKDDTGFFIRIFCMGQYIKIGSEEFCPFEQFEMLVSNKLSQKKPYIY